MAQPLLQDPPMRRTTTCSLALTVLLLAPGCQFYFGGDDDPGDDDCFSSGSEAGDSAEYPGAGIGYLDPATLVCDWSGGGGGCNDSDLEQRPDALNPAARDWAQCYGACDGLAEDSCVASDGCRAIYTAAEACGPNGMCSWVESFSRCVGTAPSGPVRGGACELLGAYECSRHDDCSALHVSDPGEFSSCRAEGSTCGAGGPGVPVPPLPPLRNPESGKCESWGWDPCLPSPAPGTGGGSDPGNGADAPIANPDWAFCDGPCENLDEASCKASDACRAIYANQYPPNVDAWQLVYTECWPTAPSGPVHGSCEDLDAHACSQHDDCVAQHESDWSGCMDYASCDWTVGPFRACADEDLPPPPPPACSTLGETNCIARADCQPLYQGVDCTCTPAGCSCDDWNFETCTVGE